MCEGLICVPGRPVCVFVSSCQLCWMQSVCVKPGSVHVCVCVHGDFPGECDITQHGLLMGVLLLLPATPSPGEHMHTQTPTEVTPTAPLPPNHTHCLCLCRLIYMCEWCLPDWINALCWMSVCWDGEGGGGTRRTSQPIRFLPTVDPPPSRQLGQSHGASHRKGP